MENCPICKQKVDEKHKHDVSKSESQKIEELDIELRAVKKSLIENKMILDSKLKEKEKIEFILKSQDIIKIKTNEKEIKEKRIREEAEKIQRINTEIVIIKEERNKLMQKRQENFQIESEIKLQKEKIEELSNNLKNLEIKKASLESEFSTLLLVTTRLEKEIASKNRDKENISRLVQLREWIEKQFINMTTLMEKSIMLRVHSELESLIQKWFSMLVDSEAVKIRIDEEFTPIIEQNGHEIEYLHLSGGEKTAAALSYRLALNQVINTLISTIKTRDILMLDEPTDGFSQDQLSRMRGILEDLKTKQTIIVSHDPMVESFVDKVIRMEKTEHSTKISF